MPVIKVIIKERNNQMDRRVQEDLRMCCPVAYFKLRLRPQDTIRRMAAEVGVCPRTIRYNRAKLKNGKLLCERRTSCLAALWLTPKQIKEHEENFFKREGK